MKKDPNSVTYREKIGWLSLRVEFYGTVKGGGRKLGNADGGLAAGKVNHLLSLSLGTHMTLIVFF